MKYINIFLLFPNLLFSQGITPALNKFVESEFFNDFKVLKERCESKMIAFNSSREFYTYSEQDIASLNKSYDDCINKFNNIIHIIKLDLLNKKKRKEIVGKIKSYSDDLKIKLNDAEKYYYANFGTLLSKVTEGRLAAASIQDVLIAAINIIDICFQQYMLMRKEFSQYRSDLIDTKFQSLLLRSSNALSKS